MDPIGSAFRSGPAACGPGAAALLWLLLALAGATASVRAAPPAQVDPHGASCLAATVAPAEPLCELDPGAAPASVAPSTTVGNPVSLVTGAKFQTETDFAVAGAPLAFRRHYLSAGAGDDAGLGRGWRHTWLVSLAATGDGGRRIVDSTGRHVLFAPPDGPDGRFAAVRAADGHIVEGAEGHVWVVPDGRRLAFRGPRLVRVDWPGHRFVELRWSEQGVRRVTDETGRSIELEYAPEREGLAAYDGDGYLERPGHLVALVLPDGGRVEYRYDARANLARARFPDGTARRYHYEDPSWPNHLTGLTERTGKRISSWAYDDAGRATVSERAGGVDAVGLLHGPVDPESGTGTTRITNADGRESVYAWRRHPTTGESLLLSARGPGCASCPPTGRDYAYDAAGRLVAVTVLDDRGAPARTLRHERDELGRPVRVTETDARGDVRLVERREYAGEGARPTRLWRPSANPDGERLVETAFDADGLVASVTERGFAPDVAGLDPTDPAAVEHPGWVPISRTTGFVHEGGRLVAIDGPRDDVDDVTRLEWDERSRLVAVRPPAAPATRVLAFDASGRPSEVRVGTASPYRLERNARGDIVSVERAGARHAYEHDAEGRLTAVVDPDGRRTEIEHDSAGRPRRLTDDAGRASTLVLDAEGRVERVRFAGVDGETVRALAYAHDAHGRVAAEARLRIDPATGERRERRTDYARDRLGRLVAITDAATGASIAIDTDEAARRTTVRLPDGTTLSLGFDALGRDVSQTDARRNRSRHLKDDFGRVALLDSPDAGPETRTHDAAGNVRVRVRDGEATRYAHDAANRLTRRENADGTSRWRHDPATGRLVEMANATTVETFAHDAEGRLVEHVRRIGGRELATRYAWDARGRLAERTLPDGERLRYRYREVGPDRGTLEAIVRVRLFGLLEEPVLAGIDLDPRDGATGHLAPGGVRVARRVDAGGELESIAIGDALRLDYRFDDDGQLVGIAENGAERRFGYRAGRLVAADTPVGHRRYAYDAAGNRTERRTRRPDGGVSTERYGYPAPGRGNRLLRVSGPGTRAGSGIGADPDAGVGPGVGAARRYRYGANGAPETAGGLHYEHDLERRPVAVRRDGRLLARYGYNPYGERVSKTVYDAAGRPTVTLFLHEGSALAAEADGEGRVRAQYLHLHGRPVARIAGGEVHAIHTDHRGAPRLMTDADGEPVWRADHTPFGETVVALERVALPLRLPGQYADAETGTHHNYLRDYDPATGRYLTSDPIGTLGGPNAYAYVGGDPLARVDPFGLYLVAFDGTWNQKEESNTNVWQLYNAYEKDREKDYVRGVGVDKGTEKLGGMFGIGARDRVDEAILNLQRHLETSDDTEIDIIGFSRGSASAREFANRITVMQANGEFAKPFTIRFMGLFDTVATNLAQDPGNSTGFGSCVTYDLSIPDSVQYVAHATALDEFRPHFPQSSINEDAGFASNGPTRVEMGFIGAHSDIGGGYDGTDPADDGGDLSDVALVWMVEQARKAGVEFELSEEQRTVSNPILHDERNWAWDLVNADRQIHYPNDPDWVRENRFPDPERSPYDVIEQRDDPNYAATRRFVRPDGTVDVPAYLHWVNTTQGINVKYAP